MVLPSRVLFLQFPLSSSPVPLAAVTNTQGLLPETTQVYYRTVLGVRSQHRAHWQKLTVWTGLYSWGSGRKYISPFLHLQDCQPFLFLCLGWSELAMPSIALLSVVTSPYDHRGERFSDFTNVRAWGPSGQPWVSTSSWNHTRRSLLSHEVTLIGSGDLWKVILLIMVC